MSATDFVVPVLSSVFSALSGGALVSYWRERRVDKAKGKVAEATVDVDVDIDRLTELEHRITQMSRTWDMERDSLTRTIAHLERESESKDRKIAELQRRIEDLDQRTTDNGS